MFFQISRHPDNSFPNHCHWGDLVVNHDNGWTLQDNILYKGTVSSGLLKIDSLKDFEKEKGTFCILEYKDNGVYVETGEKQKFPIFVDDDNLLVTNIWRDQESFQGKVFVANKIKKIPYIQPSYKNLNLSDDQIIDAVDNLIEQTILNFKTDKPFQLFVSGGVDTIILAAYLLKNKLPYELIPGEHTEMDYFLCHNRSKLKNYWAYAGGSHHWKEQRIVISGAHGDENLLRNPVSAYLILKHNNENLKSVCEQNLNLYHSKYFLQKKHLNLFDTLKDLEFDSDEKLKDWLLKGNTVDYQHWHLGNTIFFTPFDNLELFNLMLNLSYDKARNQLLDASISKELIRRNYPSLLKYVSQSKNERNFENLAKVYDGLEHLGD